MKNYNYKTIMEVERQQSELNAVIKSLWSFDNVYTKQHSVISAHLWAVSLPICNIDEVTKWLGEFTLNLAHQLQVSNFFWCISDIKY